MRNILLTVIIILLALSSKASYAGGSSKNPQTEYTVTNSVCNVVNNQLTTDRIKIYAVQNNNEHAELKCKDGSAGGTKSCSSSDSTFKITAYDKKTSGDSQIYVDFYVIAKSSDYQFATLKFEKGGNKTMPIDPDNSQPILGPTNISIAKYSPTTNDSDSNTGTIMITTAPGATVDAQHPLEIDGNYYAPCSSD